MQHHVDRSHTRNRWNRDYPPVLTVSPGDTVSLAMKDSSDGQVRPGMTLAEFAAIDKTRIHALTGPVAVDGAEPGDALEIEILEYRHEGWAWTSIMPGLGALGDEFTEPFLHIWKLEGGQTRSIPGVTLDLHPFCGIIGVQRAEPGEFRTRPPGTFGGNMDVRHLGAGRAALAAGLHAGRRPLRGRRARRAGRRRGLDQRHGGADDGHASVFTCTSAAALAAPYAVVPPALVPARYLAKPFHVFIESHEDPREAARAAVRRAIAFLQERLGLSRELALVLCSVVLDLKISQMVNGPITTISAYLPEAIFD